jgi:phosphatidylglycerophosphate synthase
VTEEIKEEIKSRVDKLLHPIATRLISLGLRPNTLTLLNLSCGLFAGILFFFHQIILACVFTLLSLLFDGLDGTVARILKISSERGEIFDRVCDRYVMGIIFLGIACANYVSSLILLVALFGVFIENYAEEMIRRVRKRTFEIAGGVRPIIVIGALTNFDVAIIILSFLYNVGGMIQVVYLAIHTLRNFKHTSA